MDIALDFVVVGVLLAIVALILLTGNFTGYSTAVSYARLSFPALTVAVASLLYGLYRFKKIFFTKENLVARILNAKNKEKIKSLIKKSSSKNAVSAVIDVLLKGVVDENNDAIYLIDDVFNIIAEKIRDEKNPGVLMHIIKNLGKCTSLLENSKAPSDIKSYYKALYSLSHHCYFNRFVKKI